LNLHPTSHIKIALVGPESTGKSTLAAQLANYFDAPLVEEYARSFIDQLDRPYRESDLVDIAREQIELEKSAIEAGHQVLICDTNLLIIKIWSEYKYGRCHPWILENMDLRSYGTYFLTGTDIPWTFDPQREHPHQREELLEIYRTELIVNGLKYQELWGNENQRFNEAVNGIRALLRR
jgi:NadR type nicotinamide-nucleotide adenylyltransferase